MRRAVALCIAAAGLIVLAGCGNEVDRGLGMKSVTGLLKPKEGNTGAMTAEQTVAAVQATLAQTDLPVVLAVLERRQQTAILVNIETNGAYRTWGSADRRTITTRSGVVTGSRGLGNDLMSSAVDGVLPLIAGRKAGQGTHALWFLDGQNHTYEVAANCNVARGGQQRITAGTLNNVLATEMTETCQVGGTSFTNRYLVDGRGQVIQSRQWMGDATGHVVIQVLR